MDSDENDIPVVRCPSMLLMLPSDTIRPDMARCLCFRREEALEDLAVRPITQFPVTLQDEVGVTRGENS